MVYRRTQCAGRRQVARDGGVPEGPAPGRRTGGSPHRRSSRSRGRSAGACSRIAAPAARSRRAGRRRALMGRSPATAPCRSIALPGAGDREPRVTPSTAVRPRPFGMPPSCPALDDAQIAAMATSGRGARGQHGVAGVEAARVRYRWRWTRPGARSLGLSARARRSRRRRSRARRRTPWRSASRPAPRRTRPPGRGRSLRRPTAWQSRIRSGAPSTPGRRR